MITVYPLPFFSFSIPLSSPPLFLFLFYFHFLSSYYFPIDFFYFSISACAFLNSISSPFLSSPFSPSLSFSLLLFLYLFVYVTLSHSISSSPLSLLVSFNLVFAFFSGIDKVHCYASVFQPLEWSLIERPPAVSTYNMHIIFILICYILPILPLIPILFYPLIIMKHLRHLLLLRHSVIYCICR